MVSEMNFCMYFVIWRLGFQGLAYDFRQTVKKQKSDGPDAWVNSFAYKIIDTSLHSVQF